MAVYIKEFSILKWGQQKEQNFDIISTKNDVQGDFYGRNMAKLKYKCYIYMYGPYSSLECVLCS